jgi:hypothetical protein
LDRLHAGGSVNANDLSIDPLTVGGCQKANDTGNIEWLSNTALRRPSSGVLVDLVVAHLLTTWNVLLANGVVHVGLDTTWSNAVDSDLLVTAV